MGKILILFLLISFNFYCQNKKTIYFEDVHFDFLNSCYFITSNECIKDTLNMQITDGEYVFTELSRLNKFFLEKNIELDNRHNGYSTVNGNFKSHMKNGYFYFTKFKISKNNQDTIIVSRQYTYYENGQRNGLDLSVDFKPIYKSGNLVSYEMTIKELKEYRNDNQIGLNFKSTRKKKRNYQFETSLIFLNKN